MDLVSSLSICAAIALAYAIGVTHGAWLVQRVREGLSVVPDLKDIKRVVGRKKVKPKDDEATPPPRNPRQPYQL